MKNRKPNLRRDFRAILANLDARWLSAASGKLCANLNTLLENELGGEIANILAWTKFFTGEPDLSGFISEQLPYRKIYLPRSLPDMGMNFISISLNWEETTGPGIYGIPEPQGGESFDFSDAGKTLVLVPGLAFDRGGNRLGRGKGYYDRFFANPLLKDVIKVGIAWSLQIVDKVDVKSHDVPVDFVCTEKNYFRSE